MRAIKYDECVQKIVDEIDAALGEHCDIDDIIRESHYSKTHFYRIFGAIVGVAPSEYRNKRRLSCAAVDIYMTGKRILDIALDYGFTSQEVFTRAFQRTLKETYNLFYGAWLPLGLELKQSDTIEIYHLKDDWLEILIPVL